MPPKNRDVERLLRQQGFRFKGQEGSHRQFEHPETGVKVTVVGRPGNEMTRSTLRKVLRNAKIEKPKSW